MIEKPNVQDEQDDPGKDAALGSVGAAGASWTGASRLLNQIATTAAFLVLARILTPQDFGLVAMAGIFIGIAVAFIDFGFGTWLVQKHPLTSQDKDTAFWATLTASAIMAVLFVGLAPALASLSGIPSLAPVLRGLAIVFPLSGLSVVQAALLTRELKYRSLAIRGFLGIFVGMSAGIGAALAGWGVWSLVLQTATAAAVSTVALWVVSPWRPSFAFSKSSLRNALAFGVGVLGVAILTPVWDQLDTYLTGVILGAEQAGQYAVGRRVVVAVVAVASGTIAGVSLPIFSRIKTDLPRLREAYVRLSGLCVASSAAVLVPIVVAGPQLVEALFGPTWEAAGRVCQYLALAQVIGAIGWVDRPALFAIGRPRMELTILILAVGSVVFAVYAGAAFGGVVGISAAMVLRQALFIPIRLAAIRSAAQVRSSRVMRQGIRTWLAVLFAIAVSLGVSRVSQGAGELPQFVLLGSLSVFAFLSALRLSNPAVLKDFLTLIPGGRGYRAARLLRLAP